MDKRIQIEIDKKVLYIRPNNDGTALESNREGEVMLTFTNKSQKFANFKVELLPIISTPAVLGVPIDQNQGHLENRTVSNWYRIEPERCTKMPPGSSTTFKIIIVKPPIPLYETTLELMARVSAIEDAQLWNVQRIILEIKKPQAPFQLIMPNKFFRASAGEQVEIPVMVYNHSGSDVTLTLNSEKLDSDWLQDGSQSKVYVEPNRYQQVDFICQVPDDGTIPSQVIEFSIEAQSNNAGSPKPENGQLEIVPVGILEFGCNPQRQQIPFRKSWRKQYPQADKNDAFQITLKNSSNCPQTIELYTTRAAQQAHDLVLPSVIPLSPDQSTSVFLKVNNQRRHWIGLKKRFFFDLNTEIQHDDDDGKPRASIRSSPEYHRLELEVLPILSLWLGLILALGAVLWLWLYQQLNPRPMHTAAVNSVQLNGTANEVFSGSSDKTIRYWKVINHIFGQTRLTHESELGQDQNQSIEIIRLKPNNNNEIAAGLDDGSIQLWDVLNNEKDPKQLLENKGSRGDRVFALEFSPDSQVLFSGHGSGWVRQWDLTNNRNQPTKKLNSGLAIQTMSTTPSGSELVIAGRFNKILFWNWNNDQIDIIDYKPQLSNENSKSNQRSNFAPIFGQQSYIESIVLAESFLVVADNQGLISVWDSNNRQDYCSQISNEEQAKRYGKLNVVLMPQSQVRPLTKIQECQAPHLIDSWVGHEGKPVRSLAIAQAQGKYYLASAGGDGNVKLWRLTSQGTRLQNSEKDTGQILKSYHGLNLRSVDIKIKDANSANPSILVTSDAPNHHVKIYRVKP